ncbi:12442_t:CDS:2, partial [Acaulospora colombiana]
TRATSRRLPQERPRTEDQLPTSPGGAILDSHVTAWQTAADNLLSAGRSEAPSRVLSAVKGVVDAVSAILEDARNYDLRLRPRTEQPIDDAMIDNLCERTQATLSNLVTASKTHATSYGLSPVSLLDAALSHVSASVTDLAKLLLVKRGPRDFDDDMHNGATNGRSGTLGVPTESFGRPNMMNRDPRFGGHSEQSSSISSSAPTVFDEPSRRRGPISEESPPSSAGQNDWNELKV